MRISRVLIERTDMAGFAAVVGFWHDFAPIKWFMDSNCVERAHF